MKDQEKGNLDEENHNISNDNTPLNFLKGSYSKDDL
jgi:hypothetical protein